MPKICDNQRRSWGTDCTNSKGILKFTFLPITLLEEITNKSIASESAKYCKDYANAYYSKVSNKRTVFNNRTGGDIILQKV